MSVFLEIVRIENGDADSGSPLPITETQLEAAVARQPRFRLLRRDGAVGVKVLSDAVAVLDGDVLTCQLQQDADVDLLSETLCELAALIPDAVVRDEEGNTVHSGRAARAGSRNRPAPGIAPAE